MELVRSNESGLHRMVQPYTEDVMDTIKPLGMSIPDALMELAKLQKVASSHQQTVDAIKTRHQAELREPEAALKKAKEAADQLEAQIIAAERMNVLNSGELTESGSFRSSDVHITIKRKPVTYVYDEAEMLKTILARKGNGSKAIKDMLTRTKIELNKTALNKALAENRFDWLPAEPAGRDITVTIAPLGDLLIKAEVDAQAAAPVADDVPAYVVKELRKMVADGYNIRKSDHVLDLVDVQTARWINANTSRYGEAVEVAIKPKRNPA